MYFAYTGSSTRRDEKRDDDDGVFRDLRRSVTSVRSLNVDLSIPIDDREFLSWPNERSECSDRIFLLVRGTYCGVIVRSGFRSELFRFPLYNTIEI